MTEKTYMNTETGSVDTYEGWDYENESGTTVNAVDLGEVVEVVNLDGEWVDFETAVNLMDDDLREDLHAKMAPCSDQGFLDAYCKAHSDKFDADFAVN